LADFFAIKSKAHEILTNTLPAFTVTWGFTERDMPRLWGYIGRMNWPEGDWKTNRSSEYRVTIPIVLNAIKARSKPEDAEAWMAAQVTSLTAAFSATSDLRSVGVITWILIPRDFGSQPHVDGVEVQAALELQVTYRP
jgi:hypothetical protein